LVYRVFVFDLFAPFEFWSLKIALRLGSGW
jgi:hypothetical protein